MSLLPSRPDAEPAEDAGPRVIGLEDDDADEVLSALSSGTARSLLAALHDEPAPPSELADRCDTSLQNVQYHLEKLENAGAIEVVETAYSEKGREMDVYAPADQPLVVFAGDDDDGSTLRTAIRRLLGAVGVLGLASFFIQAALGRLPIRFGSSAPDGDGGGGFRDGGDVEFQGEEDIEYAPTGDGAGGGNGGAPPGDADGGATPTPADDTATPEATGTPAEDTPVPETPDDVVPTEDAHDLARDVLTTAADGAEGATASAGLPPGLVFFAGGLFVLAVVGVVWYLNQR